MSAMHTGFTEVNSASNPMDQTTQNAAMVEQSNAAFNALALRSREPAELDCAAQSARLSGRHCARWVAQWCLRSLIPLPRAPPTAKDRGIWLARSEQLPWLGSHLLGANCAATIILASIPALDAILLQCVPERQRGFRVPVLSSRPSARSPHTSPK